MNTDEEKIVRGGMEFAEIMLFLGLLPWRAIFAGIAIAAAVAVGGGYYLTTHPLH